VTGLGRLAELDGRRVVVEVSATAANLGAGYDCVGMALGIANRIEVEAIARPDAGIELSVAGEGAGDLPADRSNRVVRALDAALALALDMDPSRLGWRIRMTNRIPLQRGLGSSASATIAGVVAADALTGGPLSRGEMLAIATRIEGHPDNAAPALLGGFTVSGTVPGRPGSPSTVEAIRFEVPRDLRAVIFVPELQLATSAMRAALPDSVPRIDAVHNLAAVALGVAGIASGRYELLRALTVDLLHEPYRAAVYPQLPVLVGAAREAGAIGACMSGAGSAVIAFADSAAGIAAVERAFLDVSLADSFPGRVVVAAPENAGARVVGID
jgi:homoserine kinase